MKKAFASGLNLIAPGSGFVLLGRYKLSIAFFVIYFVPICISCWLRYFVTPSGFTTLVIYTGSIHVFSFFATLVLPTSGLEPNSTKAFLSFLLWALLLLCFIVFRDSLFGWAIFHIPSSSMKPTLAPGDIIIVDTWRYRASLPMPKDIIIFTRDEIRGSVFIKRVHPVPEHIESSSRKYYVLGDNQAFSKDSRHFGLIDLSQIRGKATFILLGVNGLKLNPLR